MKNRKLRAVLSVVLCAALTAAYIVVFVMREDRVAPEIIMDSEIVEASVTAGEAALRKGITVTDETDGDVTANMVIEGVYNIKDDNTATVTYVAFDYSGNVTKATRTVKYTDYTSPVFGQEKALVFASNTEPDVLKFMTARDVVDGDISNRVKGALLSDAASLNYPGVHQVEFRVTNSMGDTQYITLPVEVYESGDYNAQVELTEYLVYLEKGQEFAPETYLKSIVVGNNSYSLGNQNGSQSGTTDVEAEGPGNGTQQNVRTYINRYVDPDSNGNPLVSIVNVDMKSDVNTDVPGQYSVTYVVDYEDRYVGYTRMNVVVEE